MLSLFGRPGLRVASLVVRHPHGFPNRHRGRELLSLPGVIEIYSSCCVGGVGMFLVMTLPGLFDVILATFAGHRPCRGSLGDGFAGDRAPFTGIFAAFVLPSASPDLLRADPLRPAAGAPEGRHGGEAAGRLLGHCRPVVICQVSVKLQMLSPRKQLRLS